MPEDEDKLRRARERRASRDVSQRAKTRYQQGREFHLGMAEIRGETPENGWRHEHRVNTSRGERRIDAARVVDPRNLQFTEYKSGRIGDKLALEQIAKDRELLEKGWSGTWVRVQGVSFGETVEKELQTLKRDFEDTLKIAYVTREQKDRAVKLGREIDARSPQLELIDSRALRDQARALERQERARDTARTRESAARAVAEMQRAQQRHQDLKRRKADRELAQQKNQLARDVADQARQVAQSRENDQWAPAQQLDQAHKALTRAAQDLEGQQQQQTREMLGWIGVTGERARVMEQILAEGRERQQAGTTRDIHQIGAAAQERAEAEEHARKEQEWAAKKAAQERQLQQLARDGQIRPELAQQLTGRISLRSPAPGEPQVAPFPCSICPALGTANMGTGTHLCG